VTIERRNFPQFFITAPTVCPYMPGRLERKVFTHLVGHEARALNTQLSQTGFRRSQNIAYRPACDGCQLCISIRVPVQSFDFSRSFRRTLKTNSDLTARIVQPRASNEHFSLFRDYVDTRHSDGGMADMTVLDFSAMIDESVVDTRLVEFRKGASSIHQGELKAVAMIDVLDDGLSMIYSFYDPQEAQRSLGTFMILDTLLRARKLGLKYLYLGYWVKGSQKMEYKARFVPQERLYPDGWRLHTNLN
jgi:leucyl-tRNA---protein transferase